MLKMINEVLIKQPNESNDEYLLRLFDYRKETGDLTFQEIKELMVEFTGIQRDVSTWARKYRNYTPLTSVEDEIMPEQLAMEELLVEAQKERFKMMDTMAQNRAYLRRVAREETILEIADRAAKTVAESKALLSPSNHKAEAAEYAEAILQLSDWHYGLEVANYWNTFNPQICRERVSALLAEVIAFCYTYGVNTLHVVNLNDLIAGRIHSTIRLESRCDVITQTIEVSEILAEFISALTHEGIEVHYYDCVDNHSRLEPIKSDALELESLTRIIPWYLKTRLVNNTLFELHHNKFGDDIITFDVYNGKYKVAAVHGHKDRPSKIVDNLTLMTKVNYDLILAAHLHHFYCEEKNETLVVNNGSLMGTDTYAKDLRLSSRASQNIILVTIDSVVDYIHRIVLN